jgi:hypothetical protein
VAFPRKAYRLAHYRNGAACPGRVAAITVNGTGRDDAGTTAVHEYW